MLKRLFLVMITTMPNCALSKQATAGFKPATNISIIILQ